MRIEKGKLYKDAVTGKLSVHFQDLDIWSDKIAVHCPTKDDWNYVVSNGYDLTTAWYKDSNYGLYSGTFFCSKKDYHVITIDQFKEFYPPQINIMKIEKGNKFLCTKDVIMFDGDIAYKKGEVYRSDIDGCITNINRDESHGWTSDDAPHIYFKPLKEVDRLYTDATYRLRELYESYKGDKFIQPGVAKYFELKLSDGEALYLRTNDDSRSPFLTYGYVTEDTFIELIGMNVDQEEDYDDPYNWVVNGMKIDSSSEKDDIVQNNGSNRKETFNPQSHYDNSRGSLYKVANELNLNHWEFDIFKRLVRCRKKGQFKQDLQKIKDTIDIYINEYDRNI